jgi:hypothetical protein
MRLLMSAFGTSGHAGRLNECLLLGVKRTLPEPAPMSAFDPKRTSASPYTAAHYLFRSAALTSYDAAPELWEGQ